MAYIDRTYMETAFGAFELEKLTDRDGSAGAIVDAVLDQAIAGAEAEVNGYLTGRYALPLQQTPEILRPWTADIARYRLHTEIVPEAVQDRYERALQQLRKIRDGHLSLGDDNPELSAEPDTGGPQFEGDERIFDRESLKGF